MRTVSQADLAVRLRLVIVRTARRLRQEAGEELSPSQGAALATIGRHGPLTPSELALRERIKRPTATRVIARLEETGLVDRTQDPVDRRSFVVALTPAGRELLARVRTRKNAYLARRLRDLDADERATLDRAAAILERVLGEAGA
jgi:DNA-binding MarR family transcriptional regulator